MNTTLYAGSLYKNYLILTGGVDIISIQVDDHDTQWNIYCNDVDVINRQKNKITLLFQGQEYTFPYIVTPNPMKDLGWL